MAKREKRLTRRQRQELYGKGPSGSPKKHIHCIACGRHLDADEFTRKTPTAAWLQCQHGSRFAACTGCTEQAQTRLDEHDRTGQPPRIAKAWH